jgi:hypothetical protein
MIKTFVLSKGCIEHEKKSERDLNQEYDRVKQALQPAARVRIRQQEQ